MKRAHQTTAQQAGTTRRQFLHHGTFAAGAVAMGLTGGQANARQGSGAAAQKGADDMELISPTYETSPTYLATYEASDRAKKLVKDTVVIDTLFSAVYPLQWKDDDQFEPVIDECIATGMDVLGICCSGDSVDSAPEVVLDAAKFYYKKIYERPEKYVLVRTADDIRDARRAGKLGIYLTHQGTNQFQGNLDNVALMKAMGFGYCLLVYNVKNAVGGGCADQTDEGLTDYGRRLIQAYNRYGMIVDVNHTGNRTALDACAASEQPVIASHSGAKAVFGSFRNLSDELIQAVAGTGGVCSLYGTGLYIDPTNPAVVGPEIIFKHMDHMVQLIGDADHVGYGSDWIPDMNKTMELVASKASTYPDMGMPEGSTKKAIQVYGATANPARILPALVDQMLTHGYPEEACRKILGGNMMRVFEEVWGGAPVEIDAQPALFHADWR